MWPVLPLAHHSDLESLIPFHFNIPRSQIFLLPAFHNRFIYRILNIGSGIQPV